MSEGDRRLNPFAFPPETNTRFTLLVATAFAVLWSAAKFGLALIIGKAIVWPLSVQGPLLLVSLAALLALLIYASHPRRLRRRLRLEPLSPGRYAPFQAEARQLAALAGLDPAPVLESSPASRHADGQAFGLRQRPVVRIGGRLPLLMSLDPDAARATLLHEYAHIANQDVGRTYFSQSLWRVVMLAGCLPLALLGSAIFIDRLLTARLLPMLRGEPVDWLPFFTSNLPVYLALMLQIGGTIALVALVRSSLLRVREVYADWRAALWGAEPGLRAILQRDAQATEQRGGLASLFRLHPDPATRLAFLDAPQRLFHVSFDIPAVAGLLVAGVLSISFGAAVELAVSAVLATDTRFTLLGDLLLGFIGIAPLLLVMWLVADTLGLQVQREAIMQMASGLPLTPLHLLKRASQALLLALSIQIGFHLQPGVSIPSMLVLIGSGPGPEVRPLAALFWTALWVLAFSAATFAWLLVADFAGRRLYGLHTGAVAPRWRRLALNALLTFDFGVVMFAAMVSHFAIYTTFDNEATLLLILGGAALALSLLVTGAAWLAIELFRLLQPRRCPACQQRSEQRMVLGRQCEHCGAELAPWLFVMAALPSAA